MIVKQLLGLWQEAAQGSQASVPRRALEHLVASTGAAGGRLSRGSEVLAEVGRFASPPVTHRLPAGREPFELALAGGTPPGEDLLLAAGTVLSAWWLREELRASRFAERRRLWETESLRAMAEVLSGQLDARAVGQSLLFHSMALLDARRGELWLADELCPGADTAGGSPGGLCVVERVGEAVLVPPTPEAVTTPRLVSPFVVAVPIGDREQSFGVLALGDREVRGGLAPFSAQDVETLSLFAAQGALAFSAILAHRQRVAQERLERELALAASVQQHLFPQLPEQLPGWELSGFSLPSRQVGGDLYDFLPNGEGSLLALFDVSGKGAPAALLAASLQGALRVAAKQAVSLKELASLLHEHLATLWAEHQFATAFFFALREDGTVRALGAGHTPAVVVGLDGQTRLLYPQGPPLGLVPNPRFEEDVLVLRKGELLVVATDGIVEASNPAGEEYGLARLRELVAACANAPLGELATRVLAGVREFTQGEAMSDDFTLVAVRRTV